LKNIGTYPLNSLIENFWNSQSGKEVDSKSGGLHFFKDCLNSKIPPSHAGAISYFLKNFFNELDKYKGKNLTDKEIN
jgi:hypothetical protein